VIIQPDAQGNFSLRADTAELHGNGINEESQGDQPNIGFWDSAEDWVSWKIQVATPGRFAVSATFATPHDGAEVSMGVGAQTVAGKVPKTGGWNQFQSTDFGSIELQQAGDQVVAVRARSADTWKAVNLRAVKLTRQ